MMVRFGAAALAALAATVVAAAPGDPGPRFVSLKKSEAFLREGPTFNHRVLWVYKRAGYPFQVIAEYDTWVRVQDVDGTVGWMHDSLLSNDRTVLVTGKERATIRQGKDSESNIVAFAEPGAVLKLEACTASVCEVDAEDVDGWIARDRIWGVGPGEVFDK